MLSRPLALLALILSLFAPNAIVEASNLELQIFSGRAVRAGDTSRPGSVRSTDGPGLCATGLCSRMPPLAWQGHDGEAGGRCAQRRSWAARSGTFRRRGGNTQWRWPCRARGGACRLEGAGDEDERRQQWGGGVLGRMAEQEMNRTPVLHSAPRADKQIMAQPWRQTRAPGCRCRRGAA